MYFLEMFMVFYIKNFEHQIAAYVNEQRIPTWGPLFALSCLFFFSTTSEVSSSVNDPRFPWFTMIFSNKYTGLFISPSGISELDCTTTPRQTRQKGAYQ